MQKKYRAAILTFQDAINFGTILQMYALKEYLTKHGYDVEILNYRCERVDKRYEPGRWLKVALCDDKSKKQIVPYFLKTLLWGPTMSLQKRRFRKFNETYFDFSKRYDLSNVCEASDIYDLLISGGDQVFSSLISDYDENYLLAFAKHVTRISYSASFGGDEIEPTEYEWLKKYLYDFDMISVREKSGEKLLRDRFSIDCYTNIDPVFLLKQNDWNEIFEKIKIKKYVVIYTVSMTGRLVDAAVRYSQNNGYKTIYLNNEWYRFHKGVKYAVSKGPEALPQYIQQAEMVFTSSFHGTALSILFNKDFVVDINASGKTSTRITELMEKVGIKNRTYDDFVNNTLSPINWSGVNAVIEQERSKTDEYFSEVLTLMNDR